MAVDVLVLVSVASVALVVLAAAVALLVARRSRRTRQGLLEDLRAARREVADLDARLAALAAEVRRGQVARADAPSATTVGDDEPDYVITALPVHLVDPPLARAARPVEQQLVEALARHEHHALEQTAPTGSSLSTAARGPALRLAVRAVALGHGVRRALAPEVLDRAAAAATVARRRSRRVRRQEMREIRRHLRAVRIEQARQGREDAA